MIVVSSELPEIMVINTSTPMPPIHWVSERHSSTLRGRWDTAVKVDEPVVVRPETVSNTASI